MKKSNGHFFALVTSILVLLTVISCKKSSSNDNSITVAHLAGTYALISVTVTVPPFPAQDVTDSIPACQRDDLFQLNTDMTSSQIDAGTQCNPPDTLNGNWSLSGNTIIIDTTHFTIQKFDGKTLVLTSIVTDMGITATTTETLAKQ